MLSRLAQITSSKADVEPKLLIVDAFAEMPASIRAELEAIDPIHPAHNFPALPADSFKRWKTNVEIKPGEMWPDGKVRPHKIMTPTGEALWLTQDEYDQLVLAERHRRRSNPVGSSSAPKPRLEIGARVYPIYPEDFTRDGFPYFVVRNIKADGRVILETLNDDLADLAAGVVMRIVDQDFVVLRASGRSATIRLKPATP